MSVVYLYVVNNIGCGFFNLLYEFSHSNTSNIEKLFAQYTIVSTCGTKGSEEQGVTKIWETNRTIGNLHPKQYSTYVTFSKISQILHLHIAQITLEFSQNNANICT